MIQDFIASLFGVLGGVGLTLLALRKLSASFLEHQLNKALAQHQNELDKQVSRLESDLSRVADVLSRRNEREFAVTEGAWERLVRALGTAQGHLGDGRAVPTFLTLRAAEAERLIDSLPFEEHEKAELRAAEAADRDEIYGRLEFARGVRESYKEWAEFKNFLSTRQIFLHPQVFERLIRLRDELHKHLVRARLYVRRPEEMPFEDRAAMGRALAVDLNNATDELAEIIRARFHFGEEASTPAREVPETAR